MSSAWDRDGSCWHDGPDRCPGCRHCVDNYTDDDEPALPRWLTDQAEPDTPPWPQTELERRRRP